MRDLIYRAMAICAMTFLVGGIVACSDADMKRQDQDTLERQTSDLDRADRPTGEMQDLRERIRAERGEMSDEIQKNTLELKVRLALLQNIGADALDLNVDPTEEGVRITGNVAQDVDQDRLAEVAREVEGVENVETDLNVEDTVTERGEAESQEFQQKLSDATVATKVKLALMQELGMDAFSINVEVNNGKVSLIGQNVDPVTQDRAIDAAENVEGVDSVDSQIG